MPAGEARCTCVTNDLGHSTLGGLTRQPPAYATFEDAYLDVLDHVSGEFEYRNAPRGNSSHEYLRLSFHLTDPRGRRIGAGPAVLAQLGWRAPVGEERG
ncbi:hypothetical protein RM844_12060 [Streptomyces sp. DSM 44915]|uniref:Uncharacterized protein n=1 Tax=Streptomyces chisholmiae TaxID=3075540 RepID=A0ABU2JS21_9ACTN|nr:hypothetical protein [Streptomyces sp. DSM 44915]MDT0267023.1 hypothetical protein [Streptomyces sp. DSM 44915]